MMILLSAAIALATTGDSLVEWVHARIASQRTPETAAPSRRPLWEEREAASGVLPASFHAPTSLAPLVKAVRNGVVNIQAKSEGDSTALGSGFVINPDGWVVTNDHVVADAKEIIVRFSDGRRFIAKVIGRDPASDVALLRTRAGTELPTVTLGDSDALEVGDWIVAIGNPFGLETSVTHGIISARERVLGIGKYDDFIQTDALINPGNSGGPLFDMNGLVVGVTTALGVQGQGIGFAVPINLVKELLPSLLDNGEVDRGWLGVSMREQSDEGPAPIVQEVYAGSPAALAGLRVGDAVVGVNGKAVRRYHQLLRHVALLVPGSKVRVDVLRQGKPLQLVAVLAQRPASLRSLQEQLIDPENLGLTLRMGARGGGLFVNDVASGSLSERADIRKGDVILTVNGAPMTSMEDFSHAFGPNDAVTMRIKRNTSLHTVSLRRRVALP